MNELNLELWDKEATVTELIENINAFKSKLNLWISQVKECNCCKINIKFNCMPILIRIEFL